MARRSRWHRGQDRTRDSARPASDKETSRGNSGDEPRAEGDDWVEYGGQLMFEVGTTSGGAPYGVTLDEFREANAAADPEAGWSRAKRALTTALGTADPEARVDVGWVSKLGDGLSRDAFGGRVDLFPDGAGRSGDYVALIPRRDAPPEYREHALREARLLRLLENSDVALRLPKVIAILTDPMRPQTNPVLVESFVSGVELDVRAGRQPGVRPWRVVAEVAAHVHRIDPTALVSVLNGYPTWSAHRRSALGAFDGLEEPELQEAAAWALAHIGPDEPATLLHGDPHGQNILLDPREESFGLIDWTGASLGDPAEDLALVTGAVREPFQIASGLEKLLEDYALCGGSPVDASGVRFHEVCMLARWYTAALAGNLAYGRPDQLRMRISNFVRRLPP